MSLFSLLFRYKDKKSPDKLGLYPESFHIPSFYGQGERFTMNARYELNKHIIFQAKYALTHYQDRNVIGSGLEQINGNIKNDLYLQLRLKF